MRAGFFSPQLFPERRRSRRPEDAVFIGVMRQRTSLAPHPFSKSPQVFFRAVMFGETGIETAGGVIDHRDQLTSRACVICFCWTSCSTPNRSRSRWLKAIRSVSIGPSATHESGHFYFAQTGHSHFAATETAFALTWVLTRPTLRSF